MRELLQVSFKGGRVDNLVVLGSVLNETPRKWVAYGLITYERKM